MEKKIKISAKFDMQEFDRDLRRMQDKLREIYAPSDAARMQRENSQRMEKAGITPAGSSQASEQRYRAAAKADMRELDQFLKINNHII